MKKIISLTLFCLFLMSCNHVPGFIKNNKTVESGLERVITQSDYTGKVLQQFNGRFNVKTTNAGGLIFWDKGKRVYLIGGIISDIEK